MKRKVILILGKTGTGKSTLAKLLLKKAPRVISIDPLLEYKGMPFLSADEMIDYHVSEGKSSFHYSLQTTHPTDVEFIFRAAWTIGNVLLVVEEADIYIDSKKGAFHSLVNQGRHRMVHLVCIVRRTPEINRAFRAQQTSLFTFYQNEPDDIEHMREWGLDAEHVTELKAVSAPFIPKEGENYLRLGESFEEIKFEEEKNLSPRTVLEIY